MDLAGHGLFQISGLFSRKSMEFYDMSNAQIVKYDGELIEARVAERADQVDDWINRLNFHRNPFDQLIVGLDCEWRPNTKRFMNNKIAILQLCVGTKCLIIQLFYLNYIPQSLTNFLNHWNNLFVGVEVERDASKLYADYGLLCRCTQDVRRVALSKWPQLFFNNQPGLSEIAYKVVGIVVPKPAEVRRSDWQSRALTAAQVVYATIDAFASFRIGFRLIRED